MWQATKDDANAERCLEKIIMFHCPVPIHAAFQHFCSDNFLLGYLRGSISATRCLFLKFSIDRSDETNKSSKNGTFIASIHKGSENVFLNRKGRH
jgi:hypothetical protein